MRPLPRIHECMADDGLRPAFNYVYLTRKQVIATDAYILAVHQANEIFDEDFLKTIPKEGLFLRKEAAIDLTRQDVFSVKYHSDMKIIEVLHIPKRSFVGPFKRYYEVLVGGKTDFTFPDHNKIWPTGPRKAVEKIGINANYLSRLSKALATNNGLKFEFYDEHGAVICTPTDSDYRFAKGLIMPIIVND